MAHRSRAARRSRRAREALPRSRRRVALGHALKLEEYVYGDGPTLIWLHGFPDHPNTASEFFRSLGRRVIAPYLRGYAPSPIAGPYDVRSLARDVIELIDRAGAPVDLAGHDWGGVITYAICEMAPDRVRRAVTLAMPHPRTFMRALRTRRQLRNSWYAGFFQLPLSARIARMRDFALIDRLWRSWSPGFVLDDERRRALHACLEASMPAPVIYYRDNRRFDIGRIETPVLQLHGENDGCIVPPGDRDARRFRERVYEVVPGVGHFLHLEDPVGIAARIDAWLS